ncbi:MAG TPA: hypothetical protein VME01_10690 [Solirubrobacteraceae bacterium]|nr:hypothetical protein [Solirubrobacteraceae bacterium]
MKRFALALAGALLMVGVLPGLASAQEIQVGATTTALSAPTCPQEPTVTETETDCAIVLTKTTAYETVSDGTANPDEITTPGVIDSFTLGISGLVIQGASLSSELTTLDDNWGGPPSAQLTVLRPIASDSGVRYAVAAQSPIEELQPYLGGVVEFPLLAPIPVVRGEILAITVPTWAPILNFGLSTTNFSYSQSHAKVLTAATTPGGAKTSSCEKQATSTTGASVSLAQTSVGDSADYGCSFKGTRVEYSALEVTAPTAKASHRHKKAHRAAKAHRRARAHRR